MIPEAKVEAGEPQAKTWRMTLEDVEPQIPLCLDFIRDNAGELGRLRGLCIALQEKKKTVRAQEFLKATGTVAERTAEAEASEAYQAVTKEIEDAEAEYRTLSVLISVREAKVEVWRSLNSRANRGHV